MKKKDLTSLLELYLEGKASVEEEQQLAVFFEKSGNQEKNTQLSASDKARLLSSFSKHARFSKQAPAIRSRLPLFISTHFWQAAAACILILISIWLFWQTKPSHQADNIAYKSITTPIGKTQRLLLPDGSVIILNANSTLSYHPDFTKHRTVTLKGEALFNIQQDKLHPFVVETSNNLLTEVLGTEFNVNSYEGLEQMKVTVLSGSVRIKKAALVLGTLTRNKTLLYNNKSGIVTQAAVDDAGNSIGWMQGEWIYDSMNANDLKVLLNNYYGIELVTSSTAKAIRTEANMNFNQKQTAQEIVDVFCAAAGCSSRWINATHVMLQ